MPAPAERLQNLPPYVFAVIGDRIRQLQAEGIDVIRLDIGNPDMPPPPHVIENLAQSATDASHHGYTGYRGIAAFREAMAKFYERRFNVKLHPLKQILPVIGSKEGIVNLILAYAGPGDAVLVPDIGYPAYSMGSLLAGADVVWYRLDPENNYRPDLSSIAPESRKRAKLMWVNYPNNPTGATIDVEGYRELISFCEENDILLVSDNPYCDVTYDGYYAPSALQAAEDTSHVIEFFSFSKTYNMAGWRLGSAMGSEQAITDLLSVKSNIDSGHFHPIYDAGIAALDTPTEWIADRNTIYANRRERILSALPDIGLEAARPQASLYIWARVKDLTATDYVEQALMNAHVSIAPGEAYGPGGAGFVRLSLGTPDERLNKALNALTHWYQNR